MQPLTVFTPWYIAGKIAAYSMTGSGMLTGSGWSDNGEFYAPPTAKSGTRFFLLVVHRHRSSNPQPGPHVPQSAGI